MNLLQLTGMAFIKRGVAGLVVDYSIVLLGVNIFIRSYELNFFELSMFIFEFEINIPPPPFILPITADNIGL